LATLDDKSIIFITLYTANLDVELANSVNFLPELSRLSAAAIYCFVGDRLNHGVTGGYMYTVDKWAHAASTAASPLINQTNAKVNIVGYFRLDYDQLRGWKLNLADMSESYIVDNKPMSILDDCVGSIYTIALLILLLLAVLCLKFLSLKRSKIANVQIEASEKKACETEVRFELLTVNSLDLIRT